MATNNNRVQLTDGSGRWFDITKATEFDEGTRWDGSNHVSLVAGGKFDHEKLYRTAGGRWILNHWSQWQGSRETYEEISNDEAARWLSICDLDPHPACADEFAALEVA